MGCLLVFFFVGCELYDFFLVGFFVVECFGDVFVCEYGDVVCDMEDFGEF